MTGKDVLYLAAGAAVMIAAGSVANAVAIGTGSWAGMVVSVIVQVVARLLFGAAGIFVIVWGAWLAAGKPQPRR